MCMVVAIRGRTLALLIAPMAVTACQATTPSSLPPKAPATASTMAATPKPSPARSHDLIVEAYSTYWPVLAEAGRSSPERARELLEPYVKGGYLNHLVDGVRDMVKQGREPYGHAVPRIKEVRVSGKYAEVTDCLDMSGAAMADRRTHRLIPETADAKTTTTVVADLERSSDGRWRLTGLSMKGTTCTSPSR
ncbi:hypothetical protein [Nonomuraea basaltis]|uniref:hypothetical protein n=1 Tax=Nonomuraea basaltis TaxID=2495887 RepID=UPI00110C4223|nr:hypothetical protein [Nonomuraea basaltis]TMR96810.1 hypothetical protein EJK15_21130 [Nonomuraea basaltis]